MDHIADVAVSPNGEVIVAGQTDSPSLPHTTGAAQPAFGGGGADAWLARFHPQLTVISQASYLGGSGYEDGYVFIDASSEEIYVVGATDSEDFPRTSGGAQSTPGAFLDGFVARLTADLRGPVAGADLVATASTVPWPLAPGTTGLVGSFSCTNAGNAPALSATCGISASEGVIASISCHPRSPVTSLPPGGTIRCSFTYTEPGNAGGSDTGPTGVSFTVTAQAQSDANPGNNARPNSGGQPVPLVDAVDETASFPAGVAAGTWIVSTNDQVGSNPPGPGTSYTYLGGTCAGAWVSSGGVATFSVPSAGACTVDYQLCFAGACDTATLRVSGAAVQAIPTLGRFGLLLLAMSLVAVAGWLLRWRAS